MTLPRIQIQTIEVEFVWIVSLVKSRSFNFVVLAVLNSKQLPIVTEFVLNLFFAVNFKFTTNQSTKMITTFNFIILINTS